MLRHVSVWPKEDTSISRSVAFVELAMAAPASQSVLPFDAVQMTAGG